MDFYKIILYISAVGLAIGPILGYIPQYLDIKRTRHYQGFSSVICFILLTSNILRILSYILERFDLALLIQSILMIIVQLLILQLIVKLSSRDILPVNSITGSTGRVVLVDNRTFLSAFWAWKSFFHYILFLTCFTSVFGAIVLVEELFFHSPLLRVTFLYLSTLIESTLCMPQVYRNWVNKSTAGLNKSLVASWFGGDVFKLGYYIFSRAPTPFTVCAAIQISVDIIIAFQIFRYRKNVASASSIERSPSTLPLKDSTTEFVMEERIDNKNLR